MQPKDDRAFRVFLAKTVEHVMTTQRAPSFQQHALQVCRKLGLTRTCALLESNLYKSRP